MSRRATFLLLVFGTLLVIFLGLGIGSYIWLEKSFFEPQARAQELKSLIDELQDRKPTDLNADQWRSAIFWTKNLHVNSYMAFETDASALKGIHDRLKRKLEKGPVSMRTIDWIWSEYSQLNDYGAQYQQFKPMMMKEIKQAS